jgi:parvulin-like peptidyl-prolyl isomerase
VAGAEHAAPSVVAVVNAEPITRQQLARECLRRWGEEVLESLVNKHLILQACRQRGVQITSQDIDAEIVRISGRFGLSAEQWLKMLQTERQVSAEQYRRDIVWPTLALRQLASDRLQVSPEELAREFESEYGPKVQVRMISLTSRAKAEQVLAQAQASPDDFPNLAKSTSEDPNSASARGLIPPIRKHMGEPEIEQVVFALQPGEISRIVHTANQFLIFRCEKHLPPANISAQYRAAAEERLRERIVERNLRQAASELFAKLQADVEVVNVYNQPALRQQMPGVAATVNGRRVTLAELAEECLVRYGREMLESEVNYTLLAQALKKRNLQVSKTQINEEIARAAESYGYLRADGSADVQRWLKEVTEQEGVQVEHYVRDAVWPSVALKQLVGEQIEISPEDLRKGFEANYGERVEVLAIVLGNQRTAQEVWDMARRNPSREFFGQLAEQYSIEPVSRANFGEIPPIRRFGGQPLIEEEAFRLKPTPPDDLSGIVAMGDKFVILKCLGHTRPYVESLEEVRPELEKAIREKKLRLAMSAEFDRLQQAAQIDNFLAGTTQPGQPQGAVAGQPGEPQVSRTAARPATYGPRRK